MTTKEKTRKPMKDEWGNCKYLTPYDGGPYCDHPKMKTSIKNPYRKCKYCISQNKETADRLRKELEKDC